MKTITVVALVLLVLSGNAFCGEIHDAAKAGDLEKVKALLKANPDLVNEKEEKGGTTPLFSAANKEVAEFLLLKGAQVNALDNGGLTPLHSAAFTGNKGVAEVLVAKGADLEASFIEDKLTPLHFAASRGSDGVAEVLVAKGAKVNAQDSTGSTPLHHAAVSGNKKFVEILLKSGADFKVKNDEEDTPLAVALRPFEGRMVKEENETDEEVMARYDKLDDRKKEIGELLRKHGAKE